jgi:hypothetical protein
VECGELYVPDDRRTHPQRFCSIACSSENRAARQRALYPSEEDMRRFVYDEKLSDAQIGAQFGHSYEWARLVRNHYGLKALPKPPHREIKHGRYIGEGRWNVGAKGEAVCRACGATARGAGPLGQLHLHHAIPRSMCRATKTDLRNGLPLCWACHSGWHERRVVVYRDAFTAVEWAFLQGVELLGQQVGPWLDANYPDRGRPFKEDG